LINLGYCEIAFHKQNKIRLTSLAKKVFEGEKVQLTTVQKIYREARIKETKNKSANFLKPYGNYVMKFPRRIRSLYNFSDAALRQMETEDQ
jgi:ATP-dependent DNA helicase RecQ